MLSENDTLAVAALAVAGLVLLIAVTKFWLEKVNVDDDARRDIEMVPAWSDSSNASLQVVSVSSCSSTTPCAPSLAES